jgi:hypothetical protein
MHGTTMKIIFPIFARVEQSKGFFGFFTVEDVTDRFFLRR